MKNKKVHRSDFLSKTGVCRRKFLSSAAIVGASGALGAGGLLTACSGGRNNKLTPLRSPDEYYIPELRNKAMDGRPLKAALIGCGSRGTGAALNFLDAGDGLSIVACADIFKDKMDRSRARLIEMKNNVIADDMCFFGFDAYKKVCELPEVDIVLVASPSLFHPDHAKYAIDRGKHVFCEKPAAIDAVGYRTYMMAVKQAQNKGLCFLTGTQRHHNRGYVESYKKIQEGYIGRIFSGNVYWNQAGVGISNRRPEWTDLEFMIRSQFNWNWLSGDHVVDQLLHNLDVFVWFSHLKPVNVIGMGSRIRRISGNCYDNFSIDFEFEGGVHVHGMARQIDGCHNRVGEIIHGTKGWWNSLEDKYTMLDPDGNVVWQFDDKKDYATQQNDARTLANADLVSHIRSGKTLNYAETMAITSMACIMARESAYTGKLCTWDEMTQSDLNFMPAELQFDKVDMSIYTTPLPGISKI